MAEKRTFEARRGALAEPAEWGNVDGRGAIHKPWAFEFMTQVALLAEKMDHYLEWFNAHDRVGVTLAIDDAGGVTDRDIRLARFVAGPRPIVTESLAAARPLTLSLALTLSLTRVPPSPARGRGSG
jgi:4a-hydroxytetrahydrobiopterin dehydratase